MREQAKSIKAGQLQTPRLLGISGSLRSGSCSTALLQAIARENWFTGELSVRTLNDIPLYNEDLDIQPALPSVAALRAEVSASDGVLIATPEYNHGVPGVLKNALDWASRPAFASCFVDKPILILTSAPGSTGGVRAQYQLRETLVSMHAHIVPGREIVLSHISTRLKEGRLADEDTKQFIAGAIKALHKEIATRAAKGKQ